jgi:hypothetical protein
MLNRAVTSAANHNPQLSPAHGVCCRQQRPAHLSALWEDQCAARGVLIIVFVYWQIFPHEHACGKQVTCRNQPCHIRWGFSLAKSLRRLQLSAVRGCALPSISFASLASSQSPFISEPLDRKFLTVLLSLTRIALLSQFVLPCSLGCCCAFGCKCS